MSRVKFGDVVKDVKINIDRLDNPYEYYVAGDHMDSEDLTIHRKGCFATDDVGPAFIRVFKPDQILYGSRRTYLKKIAVADFEGVCANTTFVFETKDPHALEQRLLPFIMLSRDFTTWSIAKSKGSTNPYVLFSDLADFEFELPPLEDQKVLADKLWAAYRLKEAYKKLLVATDEMVKSQFIEMFGDKFPNAKMSSVSTIVSGKSIPKDLEDTKGPLAYVKVADFNIDGNEKCITTSSRFVTTDNAKLSVCIPVGSVIFAKNGAASLSNKKRITVIECCIDMNTMAIIPKDNILSEFLFSIVCSIDISRYVRQGAIPSISPKSIENICFYLPPIEEQERFVYMVEQADKSKFELKQCIENIDKVIKSLING